MALALTPRLLRRGLELFAAISLSGVALLVGYYLIFKGDRVDVFLAPFGQVRWRWVPVGLVLASMDWVGGGFRLWVCTRYVHPGVRLRDMMLTAIVFPSLVKRFIQRVAGRIARRSPRAAEQMEKLLAGVDRSHDCMVAFGSPKGLLTLLLAIVISAPSHANKLLAGYVTMRILGIPADFTDILLLQTLISFLLYFAPTPGGSGLAELTSAVVMSVYVPRELTPSYTLIWRFINSYATVIVGSLIFWYWLRRGLIGREESVGVT